MIYASTYSEADRRSRIVRVNDRDYTLREYVGAAPKRGTYVEGNEVNDNAQPQGFLVDQPSDAVTLAHFHEHNQFQVFVDGDGQMGIHKAAMLGVHYAGAHTPYGPITAGAAGVRYFTLRQRWDPGAKYMPAMRKRLKRGQYRTAMADGITVTDDSELARQTAPATDTVIAPESDGLQALKYTLGPGQQFTMLDPVSGSGQYWLVLGGQIELAGAHYDALSCGYVTPDEPAVSVTAGDTGGELLLMQFPLDS